MFDFAPHGYLVTDMDGNVKEFNRAAVGMLGSKNFITDKPLLIFIAENDHKDFFRMLSTLKESHGEVERELVMRPHEAPPFLASIKVSTILGAEGKPVGLRWLIRDISDRQRAERSQLEAEKQRLSDAYNRSLKALISINDPVVYL